MKKAIHIILSFIAFIILICEPFEITIKIIIIKAICILYFYLLLKANNYFGGIENE